MKKLLIVLILSGFFCWIFIDSRTMEVREVTAYVNKRKVVKLERDFHWDRFFGYISTISGKACNKFKK